MFAGSVFKRLGSNLTFTCSSRGCTLLHGTKPNIPEQWELRTPPQYSRQAFLTAEVYLAALRHFEGPRPLRRRLRREPGPGRLRSRSVRLATVPPRPSSITSASSMTFFQKVCAAPPVAALQHPNVPDALHRVPTPCLHRASRVPAATVHPQLRSARHSIQLCTMSAAER